MNVGVGTRKKYNEVKYELKWGRVCITPCSIKEHPNGDREMVGSARCRTCSRFISIDKTNQTVICSNVEINASRKASIRKEFSKRSRRVVCVTTGEVFDSVNKATIAFELSASTIAKAINDGRLVRKKWEFRYE